MSTPRIIKRYTNRKLYDTATSCYVNFSDLRELIQKRERFIVLEKLPGVGSKDITVQTLTNILLQDLQKTYNSLDSNTLEAEIRHLTQPREEHTFG